MGAAPAYSYYPERAPERSPRERISVVPGRGARTQTPTLPSNVVFLAKAAAVVLLVVSLVGFARIGLMSATISTTMQSSQLTSRPLFGRRAGSVPEHAVQSDEGEAAGGQAGHGRPRDHGGHHSG